MSSFVLGESHFELLTTDHPKMICWLFFFISLVDQLHVECLSDISGHNFNRNFSEGFPKADSFASCPWA